MARMMYREFYQKGGFKVVILLVQLTATLRDI